MPGSGPWQLMHEWETARFDLREVAEQLPQEACRWRVASVHRSAQQMLHQWQQASRAGDDYVALPYRDLPLEINVEFPERVGMDRLIADDYHQAGLVTLTLDREMAALPNARRL